MALDSEPRLLVLHGARLKGFAEADAIALRVGVPADVAAAHLAEAEAAGWAKHRNGRRPGWMLTAEGRAEDEHLLAAELDGAGARPAITDAYERFLALNAELLATCTAWQTGPDAGGSALNDHTDGRHDREVIGRLRAVHGRVEPVADALAAVLSRFASYPRRLSHAWQQIQVGEHDWFTQPQIDSYHTIWFELHEDLLSTLGIPRGAEPASEALATSRQVRPMPAEVGR